MSLEIVNADKVKIGRSIDLTRRMRGAFFASDNRDASKTPQIFHDATDLVTASARLIVSYANDASTEDVRAELRGKLIEMNDRYTPYVELTRYGHDTGWVVNAIARDLKNLHEDSERTIYHNYNRINENEPEGKDLMTPNMVIVSPLSSDFTRAVVHKTFVTDVLEKECFDIVPAAVDPRTERAIFPMNEQGKATFEGYQRQGLYIDNPGQGKTAQMVINGMKKFDIN